MDPIASVPTSLKELRSCLLCSMVKTQDQFERDGCTNCEQYLHLKGDRLRVEECTSRNFEGIISMLQPETSWVANWQRLTRMNKGCYAISVSGSLPDRVINDLDEQGITYKSRDIQFRR
eukprot:CFRG5514T1